MRIEVRSLALINVSKKSDFFLSRRIELSCFDLGLKSGSLV